MIEDIRLTQFAAGGGCACKLPAADLEAAVAGLTGHAHRHPDLVVGLDTGDDAAAVRLPAPARPDLAASPGPTDSRPMSDTGRGELVLSTADFFTPMLDSAYDWGRVAAANALSDVYAMGGRPILAINLMAWPVDALPRELITEVLRGGLDVATQAHTPVAGGHTITGPEPTYGMAVTGLVREDQLIRNDAARAGLPLTLTKAIGVGVLNNRHKQTGERFEHAVSSMTSLNADASAAAVAVGIRAGTDVTGFGLLGHLHKMARASGVTAVLDAAAVPVLEGARQSLADGYVPGGSRRNLDWVRPHLAPGTTREDELVLLADAQTSGGLLLVGELPGHPVIGHLEIARPDGVTVAIR